MNMSDRSCSRYQPPPPPPPHRRKTPSFSSSLLDSILRSIDETTDGDHTLHHLQQQQQQQHDHDLMFFASEPKRSAKLQAHYINNNQQQQQQQMPSLRRAIIIDQWIDQTQNNSSSSSSRNRNNGYVVSPAKSTCATKLSSDSSSSGTTMFTASSASSPSTYRSLPNSFTISRNSTAEAVFLDDTQKTSSSNKREGVKFIKSTKLRAMKIYGDLKKVKQPMSPATRISAFIYSLFASSSSKKAKIKESMQNFRSLKKSRSIKLQDQATMTCTSFSRSTSFMSKKHHAGSTTHLKRSVRFYPENDTLNILDRKSTHQRTHSDSMPLPYCDQRRWFAEKNYTNNYKSFMVNIEDDDEDEDEEDDLFELEIVGGVGTGAYTQELPVFETTDLRKIRI